MQLSIVRAPIRLMVVTLISRFRGPVSRASEQHDQSGCNVSPGRWPSTPGRRDDQNSQSRATRLDGRRTTGRTVPENQEIPQASIHHNYSAAVLPHCGFSSRRRSAVLSPAETKKKFRRTRGSNRNRGPFGDSIACEPCLPPRRIGCPPGSELRTARDHAINSRRADNYRFRHDRVYQLHSKIKCGVE